MPRSVKKSTCLLIIGLAACLLSCTKKEYCTTGKVRAFFVGFDSTETRQIRLLTYKPGTNYTELIDSAVADLPFKENPGYFSQHGDTIHSSWTLIGPSEDYVLTVLPANRTWRINGIAFQLTYNTVSNGNSSPSQCPIVEYTIDGNTTVDFLEKGEIMFLKR